MWPEVGVAPKNFRAARSLIWRYATKSSPHWMNFFRWYCPFYVHVLMKKPQVIMPCQCQWSYTACIYYYKQSQSCIHAVTTSVASLSPCFCFGSKVLECYNWGERSESLPSDERCNFVCVCVCVCVMDRHDICFLYSSPFTNFYVKAAHGHKS